MGFIIFVLCIDLFLLTIQKRRSKKKGLAFDLLELVDWLFIPQKDKGKAHVHRITVY